MLRCVNGFDLYQKSVYTYILIEIKIGQLATELSVLTRNLASLERQERVQLQPGRDRRVKEISLTPKGHQRLMEIYPRWQQAQAKTEELLGQQNVQQLLAELSDITHRLGGL